MNSSNGVVARIRRPVRLVAIAWGAVSLAGVTAAVATPESGTINRNELAAGTVSDNVDIQSSGQPLDLHIMQVTIAPGANTGWHHHPGPEYAVLKSGSATLWSVPRCTRTATTNAGTALVTPIDWQARRFPSAAG